VVSAREIVLCDSHRELLLYTNASVMSGIFAYLNFLTPRTRREILDILIKGLQRLEYRGYDSAGDHFLLIYNNLHVC